MSLVQRARLVPFVFVTAVMAAFVIFGPHEPVRAGPFGWLDLGVARAVSGVFRLAGWPVVTEGPVIAHPSGFAMEIYYRCTGYLPALFVAGAILAFPVPARRRWAGAGLGVVFLLLVNFARLVGLMALGVGRPELFDVAHRVVGEWLVILSVFGYWLIWARGALAVAREPAR